ncbi:nitrate transporter [Chitinimonas prasina]|uniref:Nitrate transporter n=1 Tax=Chitinimonas prasina TaxID=1434937 RepID=A0ABQ5YA42_9NEIS|nr:nitrate/nitrite transporter [Chitinimonas prasina]GLR11242.1 nitrate transporter [Chitinimonas prasina]
MDKGFWKAGHTPTLVSAFLYFDLSFMVWVLLGPLAVYIARDLGLSPSQKGLMVATPLLAGALLRLLMGVLVDHLKPRLAGAVGQVIVMAALLVAWLAGVHSFSQVMVLGVFLGVAGASFAVALPLASRWYPPHYQGTAMGIAGAGNSGTAIAALFAPSLAKAFGWNAVFGLVLIPLLLVFVLYLVMAKDSPNCPPAKKLSEYLGVLRDRDAWWFMFFYCVTFGGFSGLASSLTVYFNDQYGLEPVQAGFYTAMCVFAGSLMRPIGGTVADKVGGIRSLLVMYTLAAACLYLVSLDLPHAWMALMALVAGMLWLGMGNGAVFQLVPQRFRKEIGVMTGLVGMAGGIGGFLLATGLGYSKQLTGSYSLGLSLFAALALFAWIGLLSVKQRWRTTWGAAHIAGAKV